MKETFRCDGRQPLIQAKKKCKATIYDKVLLMRDDFVWKIFEKNKVKRFQAYSQGFITSCQSTKIQRIQILFSSIFIALLVLFHNSCLVKMC